MRLEDGVVEESEANPLPEVVPHEAAVEPELEEVLEAEPQPLDERDGAMSADRAEASFHAVAGDGRLEGLAGEAGAFVGHEVREGEVGVEPPCAGDGFIEDGGHLLARRLVREQAPGEGEAGEDVDDDGEAEPEETHERLNDGDVDHEDVIRAARSDDPLGGTSRDSGRFGGTDVATRSFRSRGRPRERTAACG